MSDSTDDRYGPPPDERCIRCGGTERLAPIISWTRGPEGDSTQIAGWKCEACGRADIVAQMEEGAAATQQRLEAARDNPLVRWDLERNARDYAAHWRRWITEYDIEPSAALAEFVARHGSADDKGAPSAASAFVILPPPVSEVELRRAFQQRGIDDEDALLHMLEHMLRDLAIGERLDSMRTAVLLTAALESPVHESRVREYLTVQHGWSAERFEESIAWVRRNPGE